VDLSIVGLEFTQNQIVENFELNQNYPNPFNPSTEITFNIAKPGKYELSVYNVLGQKIKTLAAKKFESGQNSVIWNGLNEFGNQVSSGVYFYKLSGNEVELTKKMILIR
jgi:flagellar hook assembly protein FlgD